MAADRAYDEQRLAELAIYIAQRSLGDPRFGKTKLNKLLFLIDFTAYRELGQSMTGAVYQHLPQGPCPHQILPALRSLGPAVAWAREPTYAGVQERLMPLRPARVELFTGPEIALVDRIIDEFRGLTNQQISEESHTTMAWRLTHHGQEIPYSLALLDAEGPDDNDLRWLKEVAAGGDMEAAARQ